MDSIRQSRRLFLIAAVAVVFLAILSRFDIASDPLMSSWIPRPIASLLASSTRATRNFGTTAKSSISSMPDKTPVYFFSHGGPNVQYETRHPVFPVLQAIGQEITQKVKPKAVVVFSGHWEADRDAIEINTAEHTDLIYDFYGFPKHYYEAKYPNKGSPELASKIMGLLSKAGIKSKGVTRGLDHGVWSGFSVAFDPEQNPLNVPLVQVSLYNNEDPDLHYRLGQAVASLRDEGIVIIGAGMSVHNLRDYRFAMSSPIPQRYTVSFDEALKEATESPPAERQARMAEVTKRPDAREAHPQMDHLMPVYVAAGAAGADPGKRTWTLHEGSMGWAQYKFGRS
ncbi:Extradiol ring-cleavage dioxygenase- class III enzyme- subunit B [Apiospora kogelbergensis]|uniref:Extradiol ring-cleavage dioxygenase- class III enzyme- subunit B n=1 Tax=Apiospora kogelbergensis TaxID=1337665 RepID=UPI003131BEEF